MLLEVCVDSPRGLLAAVAGGADRIELCSALALGGLSPSSGLVYLASQAPIPVYAMVRPRPGDFVFDQDDIAAMLAEIDALRHSGIAGVVLGANSPDGRLNKDLLSRLLERAQGMGATLHRAFDLTPSLSEALETAIDLGFERVLTSGGKRAVPDAGDAISALVAQARDRIAIMPGSGINGGNVADLLKIAGIREIHASCRSPSPFPLGERSVDFGFQTRSERETDAGVVRQLRAALSPLHRPE